MPKKESWEHLELEYAKKLKNCKSEDREKLYYEAYENVSKLYIATLSSNNPEERTAGTSQKLIKKLIRCSKSNDKVLEIGCGRGYTCWKLAPHVKEIVGIDVSAPALKEARELLSNNHILNAKILKMSGYKFSENFKKESFDKVISIGVYEHFHPDDAKNHLSEVYKVLKPHGQYILLTPNKLTGPHDVTSVIYPNIKEPLGFHLNETTWTELIKAMKNSGFSKFSSNNFFLKIPVKFFIIFEKIKLYILFEKGKSILFRTLKAFMNIQLIAQK